MKECDASTTIFDIGVNSLRHCHPLSYHPIFKSHGHHWITYVFGSEITQHLLSSNNCFFERAVYVIHAAHRLGKESKCWIVHHMSAIGTRYVPSLRVTCRSLLLVILHASATLHQNRASIYDYNPCRLQCQLQACGETANRGFKIAIENGT